MYETMQASARIPVVVLTGFLGSGKTTLLNALLRDPEFANTAVIVNELGEIGVDHLLVTPVAENVLVLDSGCLCCTVLNSFRETLADLYGRRARGEVPAFERVLVETTGVADPTPVLQTLLRDSCITRDYRFDGLVTTVDAVFGLAALEQHDESVVQVSLADQLVVTKTDMTNGTCPPDLHARLKTLNDGAPILIASFGSVAASARILSPGTLRSRIPVTRPMNASRLWQHDRGIRADSFVIDGEVTWAGLAAWIDFVREFFARRMLRCKGILHVVDINRPVLLQGVQTVFAAPTPLDAWPSVDQRSRLVCISRDLDAGVLRASLNVLHAEPGTFRPSSIEELLRATHPSR